MQTLDINDYVLDGNLFSCRTCKKQMHKSDCAQIGMVETEFSNIKRFEAVVFMELLLVYLLSFLAIQVSKQF